MSLYEFLSVDGGVMNNEPLDLARQALTGPGGTDPCAGRQGHPRRDHGPAVPELAPRSVQEVRGPGRASSSSSPRPSTALISQARFKPSELAMADDPEVYSRFLIVPRRGFRADGTLKPFTIACGSLGGFGGFLSRRFREHDYQLGRRNCQWLLKQYFALPSEGDERNKLFDHWTSEARAESPQGRPGRAEGREGSGSADPADHPTDGIGGPDVPEPRWPTFTEAELAALKPKLQDRLGRVVNALVNQNVEGYLWGPLARWALKSGWWFQRSSVVDTAMATIRNDLTIRGLIGR